MRRVLTVFVMALAFVGQPVAAASLSCSMPSDADGQQAMMAMAGMDHSGHAMHSLADDNPPANDCCYDGACPMIGCMGSPSVDAAALATDGLAPAGPLSAEYVTAYLNPATSSLFRPPIAC